LSARLELQAVPIGGLPELHLGDRIGELIAARAELEDGNVIVVSQKAVSKVEGRVVRLDSVTVTSRASALADQLGKEPALVQLILDESAAVLRAERGVLICETRQGLVCANAGVDTSNVETGMAALLPHDPDLSARRIRAELSEATGVKPAVIVSDSFGRAWRIGQCEVAIGCAGIAPLDDWRGRVDAGGRELSATLIAIADDAAAAAELVRDKASGVPAVLLRGIERHVSSEDGPGARALLRPRDEDLFR
jgi:coenzyme F420-0:L-glutamate ligase/coenzyme F420-1:gamma-L-glutamate ligase